MSVELNIQQYMSLLAELKRIATALEQIAENGKPDRTLLQKVMADPEKDGFLK